jgi:tetratricopeptide (TPR) repeat protein
MRAILLSILFVAVAGPAYAQQPADRDRLRAEVWERILVRLETLPSRWDHLPAAAVPPSGRLPEQVVDPATEVERKAADALLSRIVLTPPQARARLLAEVRAQHKLTEVDLWWPLHVAQQQQLRSLDEAALILDAWLEMAEHLGRRDVLLRASGAALDLADRRLSPARLAIAAERWSALAASAHDIHGIASVGLAHGGILRRINRPNDALNVYRRARQLYRDVGDKRGEGTTWNGEAEVLVRLGQNDAALRARRQARRLFMEAGDRRGEGTTWNGEAEVLVRLGQNEAALQARDQARRLLMEVDDKLGQGVSWDGEARVLFHLDRNEGALNAYRQARALFQDIGAKEGQGASWEGEARVLFHLGQNEGALNAYRQARAFFQDVGAKAGQGASWDGEARVLFRLGQNEGALHAYRQARVLFQDIGSKAGQGACWDGEARVLFHLGQSEGALRAYRQARSLLVEVDDKQRQGDAWEGEAAVLVYLRQYEGALSAYRQARALFLDVGNKMSQGNTWGGEAAVLVRLGQHEGALTAYRQARSRFIETGSKQGQGNAWHGEAAVLFRLGQHEAALRAYRQARFLFLEVGDKQGQGDTWNGEADVLFRRGQHEGAVRAYRQARALFRDLGDKRGQGSNWDGEAEALFHLGQNEGALRAYRQARALYRDVNDKRGEGSTWLGEAGVLLRLGQNEGALRAYRQARTLYRDANDKQGHGNSWLGEGRVLYLLGQYGPARTAYQQARALHLDVNDKQGQGNSWHGEALVLYSLGQDEGALRADRQARLLYLETGDWLGQGNSWSGEARVLFRLGEIDSALRAAENAASLLKGAGAVFMLAGADEARILLAAKQEKRAIRSAENSLGLLRRWRQQGVSDFDRTTRSDWSGPYDLLIPLLASKRGSAVEKALALAEEAHAPVLLDLLTTGSRRPEDTGDVSLREERERLQQELTVIDRKLQHTIAPGERHNLQQQREAVDARLQLNELVSVGSLDSIFVNGAPIDARTRHELIREVGPILLYYVAEDETVAFLLQPGQRTPLVRRIGLSRSWLQSEVQALRYDLANSSWRQGSRERQRVLFDHLVAPFADGLTEAPQLTIIPHGPLHELSFEALLDSNDVPLFERWQVTVAPSLSALHTLRQRRGKRQPSPGSLAFLGIAGGTGLSLPYREIPEAAAWFGPTARIITQQTDSRGAYTELAPDARHILISSHGKHVAQSRSGYLELSAPDGVATRLTAGDIAHIPLRAELVTLAACETARGEAMESDERLDLTRAFLIAGADAVLATRWRIPEHPSTRRFLLDFYEALHQGGPDGKGMRKDEALTEARRRARARGDHAQFWAAWVLVGDAR